MRQLVRTALFSLLTAALLCVSALAAQTPPVKQGDFYVMVNGAYVTFTDAVPRIRSDRSCLPFVAVFEQLGFAESDMTWDGDTKTVTASRGDTTIGLTIGRQEIQLTVGGVSQTIQTDVAPYIEPTLSRTYVPFGLVADALGYAVGWDPIERTVLIDDVDAIMAAHPGRYTLLDRCLRACALQADRPIFFDGSYRIDRGPSPVDSTLPVETVQGSCTVLMEGPAMQSSCTCEILDEAGQAVTQSSELRADRRTGTMYYHAPDLVQLEGLTPNQDAWISASMTDGSSLFSDPSDILADHIVTAGTAEEYIRRQLMEFTLNRSGYTTAQYLEELNLLYSDEHFTLSPTGDSYINQVSTSPSSHTTVTFYLSGSEVTGMERTASGPSSLSSTSVEFRKGSFRFEGSTVPPSDPQGSPWTITLTGRVSNTHVHPITLPPAGADIVEQFQSFPL